MKNISKYRTATIYYASLYKIMVHSTHELFRVGILGFVAVFVLQCKFRIVSFFAPFVIVEGVTKEMSFTKITMGQERLVWLGWLWHSFTSIEVAHPVQSTVPVYDIFTRGRNCVAALAEGSPEAGERGWNGDAGGRSLGLVRRCWHEVWRR